MNVKPQPISIWAPKMIGGELYFERPRPLPLGDHYCARLRIRAQKTGKSIRVAYFGESVAAGYLYAPGLTPATILQKQLDTLVSVAEYEVLDFSRTNEMLDNLVMTVERSLQLSPDILVVFAGNNWNLLETPEFSPYYPDTQVRREYGRILETEGLAGIVEAGARRVLEKAAHAFDRIADLAGRANLPVVFIVPEVNMADWENRQPVPWLDDWKTAEWYRILHEGLHDLKNGDWESLSDRAWEMLKLDQFASSTACHLLSHAEMGLGKMDEALNACQAAIDNTYYPSIAFLSSPQAGSLAKAVIRKACGKYGFACVDLPEIYAMYTGSRLQGRRLFLDYCHFTVEGMHVAMASLASEVIKVSGGSLTWRQVLERLPMTSVEPELDAKAKFGAAIHSAHRLLTIADKKPILQYWCEEALKAFPEISQTMLEFIESRHPFCPVSLSIVQQRNLSSSCSMGYQHGWCYEYLDPDLIEVIGAVLEKSGRIPEGMVSDMLIESLDAPEAAYSDLLNPPFFLWEPLERFYPECMSGSWHTAPAFFRAAWPQSRFAFIDPGDRAGSLVITMRLPDYRQPSPQNLQNPEEPCHQGETVTLFLNGKQLVRSEAYQKWNKITCPIPPGFLKRGLNQLLFDWPLPRINGSLALKAAADRLKTGCTADVHPVFGEIFELKVTDRA